MRLMVRMKLSDLRRLDRDAFVVTGPNFSNAWHPEDLRKRVHRSSLLQLTSRPGNHMPL